jgi:hypothetical protein
MFTSASGPISPIDSDAIQASQDKGLHTGALCAICQSATKSGQHTLRCLHCTNLVHLTCQYKLFKDAGHEALRNKIDWLFDFVQFTALAYRCRACLDKLEMVPHDPNTSIPNVYQEISMMKSSISDLDLKMQTLHDAIVKLKPCCNVSSSNQPDLRPPTYSQVVSANAVKCAVSEAIREQQKVSTDRASIVIYGFPEEGCDSAQLQDMLEFLVCRCDIVRHSRIGRRFDQSTSLRVRPIKVELRSASDAFLILSRAKRLSDDSYYYNVRISKWLSDVEMKHVKSLREECDSLNLKHPCGKSNRKLFVVVSGKIMKRNLNGRLTVYNGSTDDRSNTCTISPRKTQLPHDLVDSDTSSSVPKNV